MQESKDVTLAVRLSGCPAPKLSPDLPDRARAALLDAFAAGAKWARVCETSIPVTWDEGEAFERYLLGEQPDVDEQPAPANLGRGQQMRVDEGQYVPGREDEGPGK